MSGDSTQAVTAEKAPGTQDRPSEPLRHVSGAAARTETGDADGLVWQVCGAVREPRSRSPRSWAAVLHTSCATSCASLGPLWAPCPHLTADIAPLQSQGRQEHFRADERKPLREMPGAGGAPRGLAIVPRVSTKTSGPGRKFEIAALPHSSGKESATQSQSDAPEALRLGLEPGDQSSAPSPARVRYQKSSPGLNASCRQLGTSSYWVIRAALDGQLPRKQTDHSEQGTSYRKCLCIFLVADRIACHLQKIHLPYYGI